MESNEFSIQWLVKEGIIDMKKNKKKKKDIPILLADDSQYADLPVTKTPDDIITEEEQAQIDEILKKYDF